MRATRVNYGEYIYRGFTIIKVNPTNWNLYRHNRLCTSRSTLSESKSVIDNWLDGV